MQVHSNCVALALVDIETLANQVEELVASVFVASEARGLGLAASSRRERDMESRWRSSQADAKVLQQQVYCQLCRKRAAQWQVMHLAALMCFLTGLSPRLQQQVGELSAHLATSRWML